MNILEKLTYDHDKIIKLIIDIENLGHAESQLRKPLFQLLEKELLILNEAEAEIFYKELEHNFKTRKLVNILKKQNTEIANFITCLHGDTLNSKEWHNDFNRFKKLVIDHMAKEENKLFPAADKVLSNSQEESLGEELELDKKKQWNISQKSTYISLKDSFIQKVRAA